MPDIFWGEKHLNFIYQIPMPGILSPKLWSPPTTPSLPPTPATILPSSLPRSFVLLCWSMTANW